MKENSLNTKIYIFKTNIKSSRPTFGQNKKYARKNLEIFNLCFFKTKQEYEPYFELRN